MDTRVECADPGPSASATAHVRQMGGPTSSSTPTQNVLTYRRSGIMGVDAATASKCTFSSVSTSASKSTTGDAGLGGARLSVASRRSEATESRGSSDGRRLCRPPEWISWWLVLSCVFWVVFGITSSIVLRHYILSTNNDDIERKFDDLCASFTKNVGNALMHTRSALDVAAAAFATNANLTEPQFKAVMAEWAHGPMWSRPVPPGVNWVVWLPLVTNITRAVAETSGPCGGNYTIWQFVFGRFGYRVIPSPNKSLYFPMVYTAMTGSEIRTYDATTCGLDFGSYLHNAFMDSAANATEGATGPLYYTPQMTFSSVDDPHIGFYIPYYDGGRVPPTPVTRIAALKGFGFAFLNVSASIETLGDYSGMMMFIVDETSGGFDVVHSSRSVRSRLDINSLATDNIVGRAYLSVAGRQWEFYCLPTRSYVEDHSGSEAVLVVLVTVIGSCLMILITGLLLRNRHVTHEKHRAVRHAMNEAVRGRKLAQDMIGYVNHEIRNPLNGILGLMDLTGLTLSEISKMQAMISSGSFVTSSDSSSAEAVRSNDAPLLVHTSASTADPHDDHELPQRPLVDRNKPMRLDEIGSVIRQQVDVLSADIETARNCCQLIGHIVNDVLDIRKIEEGRLVLSTSPLDAQRVIQDAIRIIRPKLEEKPQVSLVIECPEGLWVIADEYRVKQLLLNFLSNAAKFTDNGSIVLSATLRVDVNLVRFSVKDSGRGIRESEKQLIFKPYVQVRPTDGTRYTGTGLGLFLCQRLVELMDGTIGFESEYGIGSTFWFEIPWLPDSSQGYSIDEAYGQFGDGSAQPAEGNRVNSVVVTVLESEGREAIPMASMGSNNTSIAASLGRTQHNAAGLRSPVVGPSSPADPRVQSSLDNVLRGTLGIASTAGEGSLPMPPPDRPMPRLSVLVVDDMMVNRMVLRRQLEVLGHEVVTAEDGTKAVDACLARRFDVIFMDVQMPVMNGFEATQRIRDLAPGDSPTSGDVLIFGLTADITPDDVRACIAAGMDSVVAKPATQDIITATLRQSFDPVLGRLVRRSSYS